MAKLSSLIGRGSGGGGGLTEKEYTAGETLTAGQPVVVDSSGRVLSISGTSEAKTNIYVGSYSYRATLPTLIGDTGTCAIAVLDQYVNGTYYRHIPYLINFSSASTHNVSGSFRTGSGPQYRDDLVYDSYNSSNSFYFDKGATLTVKSFYNTNWYSDSSVYGIDLKAMNGFVYVVISSGSSRKLRRIRQGVMDYEVDIPMDGIDRAKIAIDPITGSMFLVTSKAGYPYRAMIHKFEDSGTALTITSSTQYTSDRYTDTPMFLSVVSYNDNIAIKYNTKLYFLTYNTSSNNFTVNKITEESSFYNGHGTGWGTQERNSGAISNFTGGVFCVPVAVEGGTAEFHTYSLKGEKSKIYSSTQTFYSFSESYSVPWASNYNLASGRALFMYGNNSSGWNSDAVGTSVKPKVSNVENYVGLTDSAATQDTSVVVKLKGSISSSHTGLSVGSMYYVNELTGDLTTTAENAEFVGQAVSQTDILVRDTIIPVSTSTGAASQDGVIKSIQQGWFELNSNSATTNITPVDVDKAVVNFLGCSPQQSRTDALGAISSFDGTTLTFFRDYNSSITYIGWQVIEYV